MKRIKVSGTTYLAEIVRIDRWLNTQQVLRLLTSRGLRPGTREELKAYLKQHHEDLRGGCTTALGTVNEGDSPVYDDFFPKHKGEKKMGSWPYNQDYLRGCTFIGIKE